MASEDQPSSSVKQKFRKFSRVFCLQMAYIGESTASSSGPLRPIFFLGRATRDYSLSSRNLSTILKVNFHYVEVYLSLFNNKILLIFCVWDTFPWYNLNLMI